MKRSSLLEYLQYLRDIVSQHPNANPVVFLPPQQNENAVAKAAREKQNELHAAIGGVNLTRDRAAILNVLNAAITEPSQANINAVQTLNIGSLALGKVKNKEKGTEQSLSSVLTALSNIDTTVAKLKTMQEANEDARDSMYSTLDATNPSDVSFFKKPAVAGLTLGAVAALAGVGFSAAIKAMYDSTTGTGDALQHFSDSEIMGITVLAIVAASLLIAGAIYVHKIRKEAEEPEKKTVPQAIDIDNLDDESRNSLISKMNKVQTQTREMKHNTREIERANRIAENTR